MATVAVKATVTHCDWLGNTSDETVVVKACENDCGNGCGNSHSVNTDHKLFYYACDSCGSVHAVSTFSILKDWPNGMYEITHYNASKIVGRKAYDGRKHEYGQCFNPSKF